MKASRGNNDNRHCTRSSRLRQVTDGIRAAKHASEGEEWSPILGIKVQRWTLGRFAGSKSLSFPCHRCTEPAIGHPEASVGPIRLVDAGSTRCQDPDTDVWSGPG